MERLPEYTADLIHVLNALGMLVDRSSDKATCRRGC
jgi:hypothetical protein